MSMFSKLKELQELRSQAKQLEEALAQISITERSSDGSVSITMSAKMEITELALSPEADAKTIKKTVNDAIRSAQKKAAEHMRATGGLNFPGLS